MTLELDDYQVAGAEFLMKHPRAGLFDEVRLGKSAQIIRAYDNLGLKRGIIVAGAGAHDAGVWRSELAKWARVPRKIIKGTTRDDLNLWLRGRVDVLLLSYTMATKWAKYIEGDIFDFLVFDECKALKGHSTQRTRAMLSTHCDGQFGLAKWAAYVHWADGTPAPNDPCDIWPFLRFCGGTSLSLRHFTDRYFRSRMGAFSARHTPRKEYAAELEQAIKSCSLRRTFKSLGKQSQPVRISTMAIDGDTTEIRTLLREHAGLEAAIMDAVEKGGLSFLDSQHIMTLRRLVGEAKAPAYAKLLAEEIADGLGKIVVYGVHIQALTIVETVLRNAGVRTVRFDGSTSKVQREMAVRSFQDPNGAHVFIGNIRSAGEAITLDAADHVDLFESDWAPGPNYQALNRTKGRGQTAQIRGRFISLARSLDEGVTQIVAEKTSALAKIGLTVDVEAA